MKRVCLNRVLEILNNNIADENVSNDMLEESLPALGMDSISFIQIIVELEEVFECEIPDEKLLIAEMDTVQKILDVLFELYNEQYNAQSTIQSDLVVGKE